jgi:diguanylate cyclase (GGDEF)-like protein
MKAGVTFRTPEDEIARRAQMARTAAALFGAAAIVTLLSIVLPHQPQVEVDGLVFVSGAAAAGAIVLVLGGERLPAWTCHVWPAFGTALVSFGLLYNGERLGGAAGGDEMYYLWVALFAAYFLGRLATAFQVGLIALSYTVTLIAIDPGPIATSRWLTTVGLTAGSAVVVRLLSERIERLVAELRLAASTDPLTGLLNRRAFEERLERELARTRRSGEPCGLLLVDVDRFKELNDRFGHASGDDALTALARTLAGAVRAVDTVARIGGDEFAVLLAGTDAEGAREAADRLTARAGIPISIGAATYGPDGQTADELSRAADAALYVAKRGGEPRRAGAR